MERLREMGQDVEMVEPQQTRATEHPSEDQTRVMAGYKATLSSTSPAWSLFRLRLIVFRPKHFSRGQGTR